MNNESKDLLANAASLRESRIGAESESIPTGSRRGEIAETREKFETLEKSVAALKDELKSIKSTLDKPWYSDVRFWAGLSAIPSLILAGQLAKAVSGDASMLRFIHKGFGTEDALTEALAGESKFRSAIETALQKRLDSNSSDLRSAIEASVRGSIFEKSLLEKLLPEQFSKFVGVRHLAVLSVGLVSPSDTKTVPCKNLKGVSLVGTAKNGATCIDFGPNSFVGTATTLFGSKPANTFDITFGISILQPTHSGKALSFVDINGSYDLNQLADIQIDETKVVPEPQRGRTGSYLIDGQKFDFSRYIVRSHKLSRDASYEAFPMHSISITARDTMPQNVIMIVAVLVMPGFDQSETSNQISR